MDKKMDAISRIAGVEGLTDAEKLRNIRETMLIGQNRTKEEIYSSVFMVLIGTALIVFMVVMESIYYQSEIGDFKMRVILALAGGAMAVGFTGNINIKLHWVQASGSIAIVFLIYFVNPGAIEREVVSLSGLSSDQSSRSIASRVTDFLIPSTYAEESIEAVALRETEKLPNSELSNYNFRVLYPIGVEELKEKSLEVGELLRADDGSNQSRVYSIGSFFRAPVNAYLFDQEYSVEIEYNRLVGEDAIESLVTSLEERLPNVNITKRPGNPVRSDIAIEFSIQ